MSLASIYKKLYQTEKWVLYHEYENIFLTNFDTKKTIELGSMYGDPCCGIIDKNNQWCMVGGEGLITYINHKIINNSTDDLSFPHSLRQTGAYKAEILTDPWSENPAIWEIDILTQNSRKIRDFETYKNKRYTDTIIW